jgi:hypothetical protein
MDPCWPNTFILESRRKTPRSTEVPCLHQDSGLIPEYAKNGTPFVTEMIYL